MWAIWISAFAVAGTISNFLYTQWATNRRDIAKWRREELQKLVGKLLQLSRDRQSDLDEAYERWEAHFQNELPRRQSSTDQHVPEMELVVEQIRLLDDDIAASAELVWKAHSSAQWDYATAGEVDPMTEIELLSVSGLDALHKAVVDDFRRVAKISKRR